MNAEYNNYKSSHSYTNTQYNDYVSSHSYSDTQYSNLNTEYSDYKSSHSHTNTEYADYGTTQYNAGQAASFPDLTEGSFTFYEAVANSDSEKNLPIQFYNTTDWYLGAVPKDDFYYAERKAGSVTLTSNSYFGGNVTLSWFRGPFAGADRANTGNSAYSYSFKYIMKASAPPSKTHSVSTTLPASSGQTAIMTIADLATALNGGPLSSGETVTAPAGRYLCFGIGGIGSRNSTVENLKVMPDSRLVDSYSGSGYQLAFGGTLTSVENNSGYIFTWNRSSKSNATGVYWNPTYKGGNRNDGGVSGSTYVIVKRI